jgi:iron complex outermembrane recepter protein
VKSSLRTGLLAATALVTLLGGPALAVEQDQPQPAGTAEQPASQAEPAAAAEPETVPASGAQPAAAQTVVVTGSRLRRNAFSSPSPITVITTESIRQGGERDITEVLQRSTAAASTTQFNNFYSGFITPGGPGAQTVGLNSLGAGRTLFLVNGRRLPISGVSGTTGFVDLQTIPGLAVDRYEILKDGASPIYGSDAVGGVINLITKTNVDGLELNFDASGPLEGGAEEFQVGAVYGKVTERWSFMATAEYFEQRALLIADRGGCAQDYVFNGVTGARGDFIDPATGEPFCFGRNETQYAWLQDSVLPASWVIDTRETATRSGFRPDTRTIRPTDPGFNPAIDTVTPRCIRPNGLIVNCATQTTILAIPGFRRLFNPPRDTIGGTPSLNQFEYNLDQVNATTLISPSSRLNIWVQGQADLDILGGIEVFGEMLLARRKSSQAGAAQFFPQIPGTSNINPLRNVASFFGLPPDVFGGGVTVATRVSNQSQTVDTAQIAFGVRGNLPEQLLFYRNGTWEFSAQTSVGNGEYSGTAALGDRLEAASSAVRDASGNLVCAIATPAGAPPCVPVNFFDPRVLRGNWTAAEAAYLFAPDTGNTEYRQTVIEASTSGDLWQIPGSTGPIGLAAGIHYRKFSINDVPGIEAQRQNTPFDSSAQITRGEDQVFEAYTEINIPLLANLPFVEALDVSGAFRYTNYDSYPSNTTWKATLEWQIIPQLTFSASSGTSYRAPALYELFLGDEVGFVNQQSIDPCIRWGTRYTPGTVIPTRCAADNIPDDFGGGQEDANLISGGGLGVLKEEESRSDIISLRWTPEFADLRVRIDGWQIKLDDQIDSFGAAGIVGACYTEDPARAAVFCSLFDRRPANAQNDAFAITEIRDDFVNINRQFVQGLDLTIDYRNEMQFGTLVLQNETRWTFKNEFGLFNDDEPSDFSGRLGQPEFVNSGRIALIRGDFQYTWSFIAIGQSTARIGRRLQTVPTLNPRPVTPGSYYSYNGLTSILDKEELETEIRHTFTVGYETDNWTINAGIQNLFDERPPALSRGITGNRLGNQYLGSQYDFEGRSVSVSVVRRF